MARFYTSPTSVMSSLEAFRRRCEEIERQIKKPVITFKVNACEYGHDWDQGQYGVKKCKTCRRYKV